MESFFPPILDEKPIPPSRAERFLSLIAGASVLPVMVLQMADVVPVHSIQEAFRGRGIPSLEPIGTVIDLLFAPLHGVVSMTSPQVAAMVQSAPNGFASAVYFGALTLCVGSLTGSAIMAMRRNRKSRFGAISDARSW
ncbi:hypothetical protein QZM25_28260 [Burkholderia contaminans]|uniref:hypothetical protein n=1 Tax=Burkholderia cepacia complex TaxID=87882 RepID=UPI001CF1ADF8|nr:MULTISPECIES: hypothetical protein [Burkholderia cepacia complex]MCA7889759.1 hypothetical protein [Burkholderia contaminans]MDN7576511.1 hypothetical protein [Burkholderia contaminans]MDN7670661.1 hypothetical protein [Burkholderia vietnamiensis]